MNHNDCGPTPSIVSNQITSAFRMDVFFFFFAPLAGELTVEAQRICVCGSGELAFCIKGADVEHVCRRVRLQYKFMCVFSSAARSNLLHCWSFANLLVREVILGVQKTNKRQQYWSLWVTLTKYWMNIETGSGSGVRRGSLSMSAPSGLPPVVWPLKSLWVAVMLTRHNSFLICLAPLQDNK